MKEKQRKTKNLPKVSKSLHYKDLSDVKYEPRYKSFRDIMNLMKIEAEIKREFQNTFPKKDFPNASITVKRKYVIIEGIPWHRGHAIRLGKGLAQVGVLGLNKKVDGSYATLNYSSKLFIRVRGHRHSRLLKEIALGIT